MTPSGIQVHPTQGLGRTMLELRVATWLAKQAKVEDPSLVTDVVFEASEGRAWSDITVEPFSCFVKFQYDESLRRST